MFVTTTGSDTTAPARVKNVAYLSWGKSTRVLAHVQEGISTCTGVHQHMYRSATAYVQECISIYTGVHQHMYRSEQHINIQECISIQIYRSASAYIQECIGLLVCT